MCPWFIDQIFAFPPDPSSPPPPKSETRAGKPGSRLQGWGADSSLIARKKYRANFNW